MKNIFASIFLLISVFFFSQEAPKILKTNFSPKALSQKVTSLADKKIAIGDIFKKHQGKTFVIDFWASWCKDCINAIPEAKILKEKNPNIDFIYFSLDRSEDKWKTSLEKFGIQDSENYWFDAGWQNDFNNDIDLNWIPRFIVVDQKGKIAKYYAITPSNPDIQKTLDKLEKK